MTESQQPLTDEMIRVLRYVDLADRAGLMLVNEWIDAYADTAVPQMSNGLRGLMNSALIPGYSVRSGRLSHYMQDVGWLVPPAVGQPRLSAIGSALVRATQSHTPLEESVAVIFSPDDPLKYGNLTREFASAREGMLVDPYFDDSLVGWLYESTSISRVLFCRKPDRLKTLELYLGGIEAQGRKLDCRYLAPRELHDRYLVADDGTISMIGASLNGIHRNFTALVKLPKEASDAVKGVIDDAWARSTKVEPKADIRDQLDSSPGTDPLEVQHDGSAPEAD